MRNINMIRLIADPGKILVNGNLKGYAVDVPEDEKDNWQEVSEADLNQESE